MEIRKEDGCLPCSDGYPQPTKPMKEIYHVDRLSSLYPPKYITSFAAQSLDAAVKAFAAKKMEGRFTIHGMHSGESADIVVLDGWLSFSDKKKGGKTS